MGSIAGLDACKEWSLDSPRIETSFHGCPARSLVTIATELSQLSIIPHKEQEVMIDFRLRVS